QHILGLRGMPRRIYTYLPDTGWGALNLVSTIGAFVIALSVLLFLLNVARSLRHGAIAGPNPWGAWTLEWRVSSPPPSYDFPYIPVVSDQREDPEAALAGLRNDRRELLVTTAFEARI